MAAEKSAPVPRMSADERREQVLGAAIRAFARSGYVGTSTDHVAREAGVSQPYVVRMFGTKLDLFLAVFERATDRIKDGVRPGARPTGRSTPRARTTGSGWARPTPGCSPTGTCCW